MNDLNTKLKYILDFVPKAAWEKLEKQTKEDLDRTSPIIKFICMSRKRFPSFVILEEHLEVNIEENVKKIKEKILDKLELQISDNYIKSISLHFAGHEFINEEKLSEKGVAYTDKVYFYIDLDNITDCSGKEKITGFKTELSYIKEKLELNQELYIHFSCYLFNSLKQNEINLTEEIWKTLLILRNFAGFMGDDVEREKQAKIALSASKYLFDTLNLIKNTNSKEKLYLQYNIVNVLEWLAYRYPNVFGKNIKEPKFHEYEDFNCNQKDILSPEDVGKRFVCNLLEIAKNNDSPLILKLEAMWAFSWAGISHPGLAIYIVNSLKQILRTPIEDKAIKMGIATALLRSTVLRFIYPDAGESSLLGGFYSLSTENALIITDVAIDDISLLAQFEDIIQNTSNEFLYGFAILYSIAGDHAKASKYFKKSANVNDKYSSFYRFGLYNMELAECSYDKIPIALDGLDDALNCFKNAKQASGLTIIKKVLKYLPLNIYRLPSKIRHKLLVLDFRMCLCNARRAFLGGIKYWKSEHFDESIDCFKNSQNLYYEMIISKKDTLTKSELALIQCYYGLSIILKNIINFYQKSEYFNNFSFKSNLEELKVNSRCTFRSYVIDKINEICNHLSPCLESTFPLKDKNFIDRLIKLVNSFLLIISACPIEGLPKIQIDLLKRTIDEDISIDTDFDTIYVPKNKNPKFCISLKTFENKKLDFFDFIKIEERSLGYFKRIQKKDIQNAHKLEFDKKVKNDMNIELEATYYSIKKPVCDIPSGKKTIYVKVKPETASPHKNDLLDITSKIIPIGSFIITIIGFILNYFELYKYSIIIIVVGILLLLISFVALKLKKG